MLWRSFRRTTRGRELLNREDTESDRASRSLRSVATEGAARSRSTSLEALGDAGALGDFLQRQVELAALFPEHGADQGGLLVAGRPRTFARRAGTASFARVRVRARNAAGMIVGCPRTVVGLLKIVSPVISKILWRNSISAGRTFLDGKQSLLYVY